MTTISVRIHVLVRGRAEELCLRMLDAQLAELGETVLRALVRVEFDLPQGSGVFPPSSSHEPVSDECFKAWMPRISAKGWLNIVQRSDKHEWFIDFPACQ